MTLFKWPNCSVLSFRIYKMGIIMVVIVSLGSVNIYVKNSGQAPAHSKY